MKPDSSSAPLGPFFEPVRRRHPGVDIVVLPDDPDLPAGELVTDEQVAQVGERVGRVANLWWSSVGEESEAPAVRIRFGPVRGTVVLAARHSQRVGLGPEVLPRLVSAVRRDGGSVREMPGKGHRLTGAVDDLRVSASWTEGRGLTLEVESQPVPVGHQRARELVRR